MSCPPPKLIVLLDPILMSRRRQSLIVVNAAGVRGSGRVEPARGVFRPRGVRIHEEAADFRDRHDVAVTGRHDRTEIGATLSSAT